MPEHDAEAQKQEFAKFVAEELAKLLTPGEEPTPEQVEEIKEHAIEIADQLTANK